MNTDRSIHESMRSHPRVRPDLRFRFQKNGGDPVYLIEDGLYRQFLHIGVPEFHFLRQLDGVTTVAAAVAASARRFGSRAIGENEAIDLLHWAGERHLLQSPETEHDAESGGTAERGTFRIMQVLFWRMPLGNPDRFMAILNRLFGWSFSLPVRLIWLAVVVWALFLAVENAGQLAGASATAILPGNWWRLILVYAVLKVIHECWHGIAVKRYGGRVPEWGIQLLAFITPLTFVDASDSWTFPGRKRRMMVTAAGMYVEFFLAACALIFWEQADPGIARAVAFDVVFMASVTTLLFNLNPLMRFDGYYMLSDLTGVHNLGPKGQSYVKWLAKRFLLGVRNAQIPAGYRQAPRLIAIYGIAAAAWRVVIWTTILLLVATLFQGAGAVLTLLILVGVGLRGAGAFIRYLYEGSGAERPRLRVALPRLAAAIALLATMLIVVRVQPSSRLPAVVEYEDSPVLRAECPGTVVEWIDEPGVWVEAGQIVVRLENRERVTELARLEIERERSRVRSREYLDEGSIAAHQAEERAIAGLDERITLESKILETLSIRAPEGGIFVSRQFSTLPGRYLMPGDEVGRIVVPDRMRVLISVPQRVRDSIAKRTGDEVELRLRGRAGFPVGARIERVEAGADSEPPHAALAATKGGPLAVRPVADIETERERGLAGSELREEDREENATGELIRPRFRAYAIPEENLSRDRMLMEGEWGYARVAWADRETLGGWIWSRTGDYLERRLRDSALQW